MNTKIVNTRTDRNCNVILTTNNKELKSYLTILQDLIDKKTTLKYVKLFKYKNSFGNPAYIFSYCCADSLEAALRRESIEVNITRTVHAVLAHESFKEAEIYLKSIYKEADHFMINEILYKIKKAA